MGPSRWLICFISCSTMVYDSCNYSQWALQWIIMIINQQTSLGVTILYQPPYLQPTREGPQGPPGDPEHLGHAEVLPHRVVLVDPPQADTLRSLPVLAEHEMVMEMLWLWDCLVDWCGGLNICVTLSSWTVLYSGKLYKYHMSDINIMAEIN